MRKNDVRYKKYDAEMCEYKYKLNWQFDNNIQLIHWFSNPSWKGKIPIGKISTAKYRKKTKVTYVKTNNIESKKVERRKNTLKRKHQLRHPHPHPHPPSRKSVLLTGGSMNVKWGLKTYSFYFLFWNISSWVSCNFKLRLDVSASESVLRNRNPRSTCCEKVVRWYMVHPM